MKTFRKKDGNIFHYDGKVFDILWNDREILGIIYQPRNKIFCSVVDFESEHLDNNRYDVIERTFNTGLAALYKKLQDVKLKPTKISTNMTNKGNKYEIVFEGSGTNLE